MTGLVLPELFADDFAFQDPDVSLTGIQSYAAGVRRLFSSSSRAEVISCSLDPQDTTLISVAWRLSGQVNIGPGITIKPYVVETDLRLRPSDGLIVFQEDRFSIPSWDILLSAFAPWLPFLAPPAPPASELAATWVPSKSKST